MKPITFRYFDVDYAGLTSSSSPVQRLISKLSSTASDRMMPLNKSESDKSDVINDYLTAMNGSIIAGTSVRIVNSRDVPVITEEMLRRNQFKVSSINVHANEKEKSCLDYFFFCLSDTRLIVTLDARSSINRFETYVNWLLNTKESGDTVSFTPAVDECNISAADMKKITISNGYDILTAGKDTSNYSIGTRLVTLKNDILKKLFSDSESLRELMDEHICSADLVIKFSKPKGMTDDDYRRKTVGAILKPIEDPDSVKFQTNGKKIKGSSILKNEIVNIDDDNGVISEQDVYQKMILRLK